MKKLSNTWKMVIGLTAFGAALGMSYFAGEMVGGVLGDWIVSKM